MVWTISYVSRHGCDTDCGCINRNWSFLEDWRNLDEEWRCQLVARPSQLLQWHWMLMVDRYWPSESTFLGRRVRNLKLYSMKDTNEWRNRLGFTFFNNVPGQEHWAHEYEVDLCAVLLNKRCVSSQLPVKHESRSFVSHSVCDQQPPQTVFLEVHRRRRITCLLQDRRYL